MVKLSFKEAGSSHQLAVMVIFFVAIRIAARTALFAVFETDPVDDVGLFSDMAQNPIGQYIGQGPGVARQFPPLFGWLVLPIGWLQALGLQPGDAARVWFGAFELVMVLPLAHRAAAGGQYLLALFWLACPPLLATSTVFVQDEIIAATLLTVTLRVSGFDRQWMPMWLSSCFAAAKIFFAPIVLLALPGRPWRVYLASVVVLVVGYGGRLMHSGLDLPILGNHFGVSIWSASFMAGIGISNMARWSTIMVGVWTFGWLWWAFATRPNRECTEVGTLGYLWGAFALLYHTNPEYYAIPFSLTCARWRANALRPNALLGHAAAATLPFVHNVLHGLPKAPAIYQRIGPVWIEKAEDLSILLLAAMSVVVVATAIMTITRTPSGAEPVNR